MWPQSGTAHHGVAVVPLPAPRRCWTLVEDVGTGVWEVADFDVREAIAVAMPLPHWDGRQWVEPFGAHGMLLTWSPNSAPPDDDGFWWLTEESLYWSEAEARRAAREHTRAARAERRRQARSAKKASDRVSPA